VFAQPALPHPLLLLTDPPHPATAFLSLSPRNIIGLHFYASSQFLVSLYSVPSFPFSEKILTKHKGNQMKTGRRGLEACDFHKDETFQKPEHRSAAASTLGTFIKGMQREWVLLPLWRHHSYQYGGSRA